MDSNGLWLALILPFLGTALGSACVFLLRSKLNNLLEKALLGFASGVMVAASMWSLIIPAIEMGSERGNLAVVPAAVGFLLGIGFLLILDLIIPHLHIDSKDPEGPKSRISRTGMLALAVTLHNIPEGMAVGVVVAGALAEGGAISVASAIALSVGIAIQNFPEGAIISMPMRNAGNSRLKSFGIGTLSGLVEPVGTVITILIASYILPILPYFLCFAAGAMIYVVIEELIPEYSSGEHSNIGTLGFAAGFVLMMVLDVVFG